ncbi:MAG: hypothetical protein AAF939_02505 [Planctomycetota bacterium]
MTNSSHILNRTEIATMVSTPMEILVISAECRDGMNESPGTSILACPVDPLAGFT